MGWDDQTEIIAKCKEIAPSAFIKEMPSSKVRNVVIDDGPTRLRYRKGPNDDYTFTGQEFYNLFIRPMHDDFKDATGTWIECIDIDVFMPRAKFPEQQRRKEIRIKGEKKKAEKGIKVIPLPKYDSKSYFCESGIRSEDGTFTQRFNIQSVTANSTLRAKLMDFCEEMLLHDPLPIGRSVIMHHQAAGPVQFLRIHDQQANARLRLNSHNHPFGEADQQLGYWTHVYASMHEQDVMRPENIEVRSIDSDMLGILCHVVSITKREGKEKPTQVYWNRGVKQGSKTGEKHPLIWINRLVECLEKRGFPVKSLIMTAHIFGSDFAVKANLCPRSTFKTAGATVLKEIKDLNAITISSEDLVKRNQFAVWAHMLYFPDGNALDALPHFFKSLTLSDDEEPAKPEDYRFEKACSIIEQFVWKFPGVKPGADVAKGCLDVLWATQYHTFPFDKIRVDRPSNFIEVDDTI